MRRDNQRSRVYGAEIHGDRIGRGTVPDVQAWVDSITDSTWWRARTSVNQVEVRDGRGRTSACAGYDHIRLPKWARSDGIVLHELAHVITSNRHVGVAPHGREFTAAYLALVKRFVGKDRYQTQRERFRERRVKVGAMPKPIRSGARPRVSCRQCGRAVTTNRAWRVTGLMSVSFCTKGHLQAWIGEHTRRG